ncbi:MAG: glycoside hydrolase family 127 protein [Muribaculaceae bacterium]|nr:glycoside hydrolase family 127 protein [Muribaculaceae bacterium]
MKLRFWICAALLAGALTTAHAAQKGAPQIQSVRINGYVGDRIDKCIEHVTMPVDVDRLVQPFRAQDETQNRWQGEFWGKWVQGAIASYRYNGDAALYEKIKNSVDLMIATQLPDGYMGNYDKQHQLQGWDVWGRKYTTLGLLKWYDLSGDKKALDAACRLINYTITQIGPGATPVYKTGCYKGMASGSILEPVVMLYNATKNPKYLDFAKHLAQSLDEKGGPQLITLADTRLDRRFPVEEPDMWWSNENGQKAYEMMSCYVGFLELYKVTGEKRYLDAVEAVMKHIMDEEINICGSGAASECWFGGKLRQTEPNCDAMETCVTFTWMQINERLLQITGKPVYAENIEKTTFNALIASMKCDGTEIVKYTPLDGFRMGADGQCDMPLHCCNANGPRAFAMIPRYAYCVQDGAVEVNMFTPSEATIKVGKEMVKLGMTTGYPASGNVEIAVECKKKAAFPLKVRIPAWAEGADVQVNGVSVNGAVAGQYCVINREWNNGDKVTVDFEMSARLEKLNGFQAIVRGPITLARDNRFNDGHVDEACIIPADKDGKVELKAVAAPKDMWMAYELVVPVGTYGNDGQMPKRTIHLCDFASACNDWDFNGRCRVWLPRTVEVRFDPRR